VPIPPFELGPIRFTNFRGGQEFIDYVRDSERTLSKHGLPSTLCREDSYPEKDSPSLMFKMEFAATGRAIGHFAIYKPKTLSAAGQIRRLSVMAAPIMENDQTAAWGQLTARIFRALLRTDIPLDDGRIYRVVEIRFPGWDRGDDPIHVWPIGKTPNLLASLAAEGLIAEQGDLPDPYLEGRQMRPMLRRVTLAR